MRTWDIFCKVIDNYGDAGVCWRLANDLVARQQRVQLWIDQPQILTWLAEQTPPNLTIKHWTDDMPAITAGDVLVEAFGCNIDNFIDPASFSIQLQRQVWLNLEYLSGEDYVQRSHLLLSPCMSGPLQGRDKYFFYPGFTQKTGGLICEQNLSARKNNFDRNSWLKSIGISVQPNQQIISLFCYEPINLINLLRQLVLSQQVFLLLITAGRSQQIFQQTWDKLKSEFTATQLQQLSYSLLPFMSQTEFDHLLWSGDLNFVRGEDSLVRAIWAGKPFIWQIYPQHDDAHLTKLTAFLNLYLNDAPAELSNKIKQWFNWWNATTSYNLVELNSLFSKDWLALSQQNCLKLQQQNNLSDNLLEFVTEKSLQ